MSDFDSQDYDPAAKKKVPSNQRHLFMGSKRKERPDNTHNLWGEPQGKRARTGSKAICPPPGPTASAAPQPHAPFDPLLVDLSDRIGLHILRRSELNRVCAAHGIKANGTNDALIARLCAKASTSPPRARAGPNKKHPVHWYADGDILVQIDGIRFKLHRGPLVRLSEWFRRTSEHGDEAPKLVGNVPLYHLDGLDLDAHDFEVLLDALDNAITYVHKTPSFTTIASILHASTALSFPKFVSYASKYLNEMWSPSIATLSSGPIQYAAESIALARRYSLAPSIIKRALYELVRLEGFGQAKLVTGDQGSDAGDTRLDARDLGTLIYAREQLTSTWNAAADPDEFPPCAETADVTGRTETACTATSSTRSLEVHVKLVKASGMFKKYKYDPVCGLYKLANAPWAEEGFCKACVERRRKTGLDEWFKVWNELDGWFGLKDA